MSVHDTCCSSGVTKSFSRHKKCTSVLSANALSSHRHGSSSNEKPQASTSEMIKSSLDAKHSLSKVLHG